MKNDLIYQSEDGSLKLDVKFDKETVWLTQEQIGFLYGKSKSTINEHIQNIFNSEELKKDEVINKFGISEFAKKPMFYYNLDVILSVGYRVNSKNAIKFRQWATKILKELVTMFLDYVENLVDRTQQPLYIDDWENKTNDFLHFYSYQLLNNKGKVSRTTANSKKEYNIFDKEEKEKLEAEQEDIKEIEKISKKLKK